MKVEAPQERACSHSIILRRTVLSISGFMGALRSTVAATYASRPPETAAARPARLCSA